MVRPLAVVLAQRELCDTWSASTRSMARRSAVALAQRDILLDYWRRSGGKTMPEDDLSAIGPLRQRLSILEAAFSELERRLVAIERQIGERVHEQRQYARPRTEGNQ